MLTNEEEESRENQKKFPVNIFLVWTISVAVLPYSHENIQQDKAKSHHCYKAAAGPVMYPCISVLSCLVEVRAQSKSYPPMFYCDCSP